MAYRYFSISHNYLVRPNLNIIIICSRCVDNDRFALYCCQDCSLWTDKNISFICSRFTSTVSMWRLLSGKYIIFYVYSLSLVPFLVNYRGKRFTRSLYGYVTIISSILSRLFRKALAQAL